MNPALTIHNYRPNGKCHCDGFTTDKYINGDYEVRVRKKAGTFKIKHHGSSITSWIPVGQLENKLNEIHTKTIQA